MPLTRRDLLAGAAGVAVAAGGVYELVDRLTRAPKRAAPLVSRRREQLVRGDDRELVERAAKELVELEVFRPTSIRKGFAGGGFEGGRSLPKRMALAAGIVGAELIPDTAELFLGFTSTQKAGLGPPRIADFNTLDNPFFWSADPERDGMAEGPAAGVHFVVFNPTSDDFNRTRLAMDGVLPDGSRLPFEPRARGQGLNSVLTTTHRQNFLVPPRRHRSFPLAEM